MKNFKPCENEVNYKERNRNLQSLWDVLQAIISAVLIVTLIGAVIMFGYSIAELSSTECPETIITERDDGVITLYLEVCDAREKIGSFYLGEDTP